MGLENREKRLIIFPLIALFWLVITIVASAEELTGEEILEKTRGKMLMAKSGVALFNLITEREGRELSCQKIKIYRKITKEEEKQLIEYLEPPDLKGSKFLFLIDQGIMYSHLPDIPREPRPVNIKSTEGKKAFMGTEFTYEEIAGTENYEKEYDVQKLKEEIFENYPCYCLKLTPKEKESEYSLIKMWVWKEEFLPLKIEFYGEEGKLKKVLSNKDIKKKNTHYIPYTIMMSNEIKKTKTIIEILEIEEKEPDEEYFTMRYLRR